ncbi:MAG: ROK family protein [Victivallales bacterium]|nr:ROK family protein [Victivallales bacterium]
MNYLSYDIGGTFIKYGIINDEGEILLKDKFHTPKENCKTTIPAELIKKANSLNSEYNLKNIGISTAGQVSSTKGLVGYTANLPDFSNCKIVEAVENGTGIKTLVENDANCAALGEMWKGAGKNFRYSVCITLGTGVGGAVIINRELYKGAHEVASEFGRLIIGGPVPGSDEFVFDNTGSTKSLIKRYELLTGESITGEELMKLVKKRKSEALYVYMEFLNYLITGIRTIAYFFDPEVIIIGGGISAQGKYFFDKVNSIYQNTVLPAYKHIKIVKAGLENDAGILGGAYICKNQDYSI